MTTYTYVEDGYVVGERLLETVMFVIKIEGETIADLSVTDVQLDLGQGIGVVQYFDKLNAPYWLQQMKEHAEHVLNDIRTNCPDVLDEIYTDLNEDGSIEY